MDNIAKAIAPIDRPVVIVTDCEPALFESAKQVFAGSGKAMSHVMCRTHARTAINKRVKEELPVITTVLEEAQKVAKLFVVECWNKWLHSASKNDAQQFFSERVAELLELDATLQRLRPHVLVALEIDAVDDSVLREYASALIPAIRRIFVYIDKQWGTYASSLCMFGVPSALFSAGPRGSNNYAEAAGQRLSQFIAGGTSSVTTAGALIAALVNYHQMDAARFISERKEKSGVLKAPKATLPHRPRPKNLTGMIEQTRRQQAAALKKQKSDNSEGPEGAGGSEDEEVRLCFEPSIAD